jgi:hypothetical protein
MTYVIDSTDIPDADIPGLTWHVRLEPDEFETEPIGDGYTHKQIAAFKRDDWSYVVVVVSPAWAGIDLEQFSQVLGSVEYGRVTLTDEDDNVTGVRDIDLAYMIAGMPDDDPGYPVPDMIAEARRAMAAKLPEVARSLTDLARAIQRAEASQV